MTRQKDVASFRVKHSVQQLSIDAYAHSHTGSYGDVYNAVQSPGTSVCHLSQTGAVYIRIQSHGNLELILKPAQKILVPPCQLRRVQNISVSL